MTTESDFGHPCRLYLISPPQIEDVDTFATALRDALKGGDVGVFQLRLKDTPDATIYNAARALLPICKEAEVCFLINDRPDICAEVGADGIHMGQEDLVKTDIDTARHIMGPDMVVGISCHDSSHLAMEAGDMGADYVAFGAFHPTTSKEPEKLAKYGTPTPDILEWWSTYTVLPCVAIGGMTPENCVPMVQAGADFIAAINAVWNHPEGPQKAVAAFNSAIAQALSERKKAA